MFGVRYRYALYKQTFSLLSFSGSVGGKCTTMKGTFTLIINVVNIIFTIAFIIHFLTLAYFIIYPNLPEVKVYEADLKDIDFPLSFQLCIHRESYVKQHVVNFQKHGYFDLTQFYRGMVMLNHSLIGWHGLKEDGTTFGSLRGIIDYLIQIDIMKHLNFTSLDNSFNSF